MEHGGISGARAAAANSRRDIVIFLACVAATLAVQLATEALFPLLRQQGESLDDTLIYAAKTVELVECPRQNCPALQDIAAQATAPTADRAQQILRQRVHEAALFIYHPVFSLLLEGAHRLGASYQAASMWLGVAAYAVVLAGIALLLYELVGPRAAAIGLLLLGPLLFQLRGMLVPGSMAVGMCMLLWALIIRYRERAAMPALLFAPLLLGYHIAAQPLVLIAAVLYVAVAAPAGRKRALVVAGVLAGMVVLHVILQHSVPAPRLKPVPAVYPEGVTRLILFKLNALGAWAILVAWGAGLLHLAVALGAAGAGALAVRQQARAPLLVILAGLAGLLLVSLLYPMPLHVAGDAFRRFFFPMAVVLTGLAGAGLLQLWEMACTRLEAARRERGRFAVAAPAGIAALALVGAAAVYVNDWRNFTRQAKSRLARMDAPFSPQQTGKMRNLAPAGAAILVMDWEILFHVFVERMLDRHLVYYPIVKGPDEHEWLARRPLAAGMAWHPFRRYDDALHDGLRLTANDRMTIGAERPTSNPYEFSLYSKSASSLRFTIKYTDGTTRSEPAVTLRRREERRVSIPGSGVSEIQIEAERGAQYFLRGFRAGAEQVASWPWNAGIWMARSGRGEKPDHRLVFDGRALFPTSCTAIDIVDDSGYLVLARLACAPMK